MRPVFKKILLPANLLICIVCTAQQEKRDSIEGIWTGTSLCQVKASACHDENVVYHISKARMKKAYIIQMNKIVNGAEEEMGEITIAYDESKRILLGETKDSQGRTGVWIFKAEGNQIHGTLTINGSTLFRIIEVKKT